MTDAVPDAAPEPNTEDVPSLSSIRRMGLSCIEDVLIELFEDEEHSAAASAGWAALELIAAITAEVEDEDEIPEAEHATEKEPPTG